MAKKTLDNTNSSDKTAKQVPVKAKQQGTKKPNIFKRLGKLFKEIISELKKVRWPDGKTVLTSTTVVIVVVLFFFLVLFGIDSLLLWLFNLLIGA